MTHMVGDALALHLPELVTRPLDILVVERNHDIRQLFTSLLNHFGHRAVSVSDAEAALRLVDGKRVDAVVSGLTLPCMDGFTLAGLLRLHPNAGGARLIAVSGAAGQEVTERALRAGFDAHFCKPVGVEDILLALTAEAAPSGA
ncbi:response regulator [Massilia sp. PAMC28688]|uniref:response regulator n=1 Tax=Massilia sp. PAMC28688 TaxID=2861283 RepID=UPI001C631BC5|nr:response regulator [Massilia sp. PAMC28688]QYF93446.1 response regulator [Massilia sp. PAMC28688]